MPDAEAECAIYAFLLEGGSGRAAGAGYRLALIRPYTIVSSGPERHSLARMSHNCARYPGAVRACQRAAVRA